MEQITKKAQVGRLNPVENGNHVPSRPQWIRFWAADRFDQDRPLDRGRSLGCTREILGGKIVLLLWRRLGHPIAVQRIESAYAEDLANADSDLDVVAKLR